MLTCRYKKSQQSSCLMKMLTCRHKKSQQSSCLTKMLTCRYKKVSKAAVWRKCWPDCNKIYLPAQAPGACRYLPFCKQVTFILVLYKKVRTFIFVYNSLFCNCSKEHIKHSIIFFIFSWTPISASLHRIRMQALMKKSSAIRSIHLQRLHAATLVRYSILARLRSRTWKKSLHAATTARTLNFRFSIFFNF